jgi:hypothetical protein
VADPCGVNGGDDRVQVTDKKTRGKETLGRPRRKWIDCIEIGLGGADWIGLAQDRYRLKILGNAVMNLRVPYNAGKLPSGCTTCDPSRGAQLHRVS